VTCYKCVVQDGCCLFRTDLCLPPVERTLEELLEIDPFAQILLLMCRRGYLWNPCSGPNSAGYSESELLLDLQSEFPTSNWNETNLTDYLLAGLGRGILKRLVEEETTTWFANQNLLNVNPANWRYEIVCPQFCAKKACRKPTDLRFYV
jgi:hypothetical protein